MLTTCCRRKSLSLLAALMLAFGAATASAQVTPPPHDQGAVGLGLALRHLPTDGSVLYVTAHPDDENNGVLVMLNRGRGLRTALLTSTRGDGGQNEIGPELFQAIGILRTEELENVHRYDGAEQYYSRAYEFGYSFSVEETYEKWGHDEILGDIVRVIRMVRPDVIITMPREAPGGGQHHQATARLAHEAFRVAADPTRYPEQLREGLRPWQARKVYQTAGGGPGDMGSGPAPAGVVSVSTADFDPLLGMSYHQFGTLARSAHRCQGMGQLEAFPTVGVARFSLVDSEPAVTGTEDDILSGIDTSLTRLVKLAGAEAAKVPTLAADLQAIEADARRALDAFDALAPHRTLAPIAAGLTKVRALREKIGSSAMAADVKAELDFRLERKEKDFVKALTLAQGLVVHVTVNDGNVVRGQTFTATVQAFNTGKEPVAIDRIALSVPEGWTAVLKEGAPRRLGANESVSLVYDVTVGPAARYSQPYWKYNPSVDRYDIERPQDFPRPWSPPDVVASVRFTSAGVGAEITSPAYYRYDGPWAGGEKQKVVNVVPALSVRLSPEIAIVPIAAAGKPREFRVAVLNNATSGSTVAVRLEAPAGWKVEPAEASLTFALEEEEATARFFVTPPAGLTEGEATIRAVAVRNGEEFREGYQVIAYDHIQARHLYHPAEASVKIIDVAVAPNVSVGYIMGAGDEVPEAIRQLGVPVTLLSSDDIAYGDLSRFTTIMTGIRAYEQRPDLRAHNQRLFDYVRAGGHLIVQYNKVGFNWLGGRSPGFGAKPPESSPYVPYPGVVTSNRVTVEEAPITVLTPDRTELTTPNRIGERDWANWRQERGLYFFGAKDPRYVDLLASQDPWEKNPGVKKGMLTVAPLGEGTWTYVGLGLWRQLPAGTPGAYRILANLISRPRPAADVPTGQ